MLRADDVPAPGGRRSALGRWWHAERRRTWLAAKELERLVGSSSARRERWVVLALLAILPAAKSVQVLSESLDTPLLVAWRQAVMAVVLFSWFVVATRDDRRERRVALGPSLGFVVAGSGASKAGATLGRAALVAAFLAGFVVAPTWGRLPLVMLSLVGAASLWWVSRRQEAHPDGRSSAESALLVTLLPPILVYAVVGVVLLADERPSEAHAWEVLRVVVVTATGEELIYRGLLLALAARTFGAGMAVVATSVSFGLWHVGDAWDAVEGSFLVQLAAVVVVVVGSGVGGVVFAWSRIRTGSLVGPILLHTATNLPGIALGVEVDAELAAASAVRA